MANPAFKGELMKKKLFALFLTVILALGLLNGVTAVSPKYINKDYKDLVDFIVEVEPGRDIKVLHLTDTQTIDSSQQRTPDRLGSKNTEDWKPQKMEQNMFRYIRQVIGDTQPDLILLTGDLIYGDFDDNGSAFLELINFMDSFQIPWAPVYGNHEAESKKGVDWQSIQLEKSKYALFKQDTFYKGDIITGNSNYTVGVVQNDKLLRVFFMMDSNGNRDMSTQSNNGHTASTNGFKYDERGDGRFPDQVEWFEDRAQAIKSKYPKVKLSFAFHIQLSIFEKAFEKYNFDGFNPVDLDKVGRDGDFGFLGRPIKDVWDKDHRVWNSLKALGVDSIFVGHEHSNSASITYQGVRLQYGLKSSTYDRANYLKADGSVEVGTYSVVHDKALVGGTLNVLSQTDGSLKSGRLVLYDHSRSEGSGDLTELCPSGNFKQYVNAKERTCTTAGYSGDTVCQETGKVIAKGVSLNKLGHIPGKIVGKVEATSTKEGYTGDNVCKVCGALISKGSVIAKLAGGTSGSSQASKESDVSDLTDHVSGELSDSDVEDVSSLEQDTSQSLASDSGSQDTDTSQDDPDKSQDQTSDKDPEDDSNKEDKKKNLLPWILASSAVVVVLGALATLLILKKKKKAK